MWQTSKTMVREGSTAAATGTAIGNQDTESTPGSTSGETQECGNEEDRGRKEKVKTGTAGNHTLNKSLGSKQVAANTGKRPSQNQNHVGRKHEFHTLDGAFHEVMERNHAGDGMYMMNATPKAPKEAQTRALEAEQLPSAAATV